MEKHNYVISIFLLLFLITFSSAALEVGITDGGISKAIGLDLNLKPLDINSGGNYSINVNSSYWWNTGDRGPIRNVADIEHNWLSNLLWSTAGHIMDTFLNMSGNNIIDVENLEVNENITASYYLGDGSQLTGIEGNFNSTAWNRSGTNVYLSNSGDNVGIGTTNPVGKVEIFGNDEILLNVTDGDGHFFYVNGSSGDTYISGITYASDFVVRNLSSIYFGEDIDNFTAEISARTVSAGDLSRNAITADSDFGVANNYNGTSLLGIFNSNNSEYSGAGISCVNNIGDSIAFFKPSTNLLSGDSYVVGNGGDIKIINSNNSISLGFYNTQIETVLATLTGFTGRFDVMTITNESEVSINGSLDVIDNTELNGNLTVNTDTLFVDSSSGNVGIGTASPGQKLVVVGDMNVTGTSYLRNVTADYIDYYNDVTKRNDDEYLYIQGDNVTNDSVRLGIGIKGGKYQGLVEKLTDGAWNPTGWITGGDTIYIGSRMGIGSVGRWAVTEDVEGIFYFHAVSEFDREESLGTSIMPFIHNFTERHEVYSENSTLWNSNEFLFTYNSLESKISNKMYIQTGSIPATQPVTLTISTGSYDGDIIFQENYPDILFEPLQEISLTLDGYLEFNKNRIYYFNLSSSENFSLRSNPSKTRLWMAFDLANLRVDDLAQTPEWLSGTNFSIGNLTTQNGTIYICNTTGVQTGTFSNNTDKWVKLGKAQGANGAIQYNEDGLFKGTDKLIWSEATNFLNIDGDVNITGDLIVNNSDFFVDVSAGRVGIGTSSPNEMLSVIGNIGSDGSFLQSAGGLAIDSFLSNSSILGGAYSVDVVGDYAYIASYNSDSLTIVDISNSESPEVVGYLLDATNMNEVQNVRVVGKYAYVVANWDTISIIDVSNPTSPTFVGKLVDGTNLAGAYNLYVAGKYAYVASYDIHSLAVVDVSNPTDPTLVGSYTNSTSMRYPTFVDVVGDYAYVTGEFFMDSLSIIDISNPTSPVFSGVVINSTVMDSPWGVDVSGRYAYVVSGTSNSLAIVDISDSSNPTISGYLIDNSNFNGAQAVKVFGDYVYVLAYSDRSVSLIDISDVSNPFIVNKVKNTVNLNGPYSLDVVGKKVYVASYGSNSLTIIDFNGIDSPAANIGGISASSIDVSDNLNVDNDLSVGSSLTVGGDIFGIGNVDVIGDVEVSGVYYGNGSQLNTNSSTWWASVSGWVSGWFIQNGYNLDFNETKLNNTIDSRLISENDTLQSVTNRGNSTTNSIQIDTDGDETTTIGGDFAVNNSDLYVDVSTGRVGIGTVTPSRGVEIANAGGVEGILLFSGTNGGDGEGIQYVDAGGSERYGLFFPGSDVVALANRALNGTVEIRANTATAGVGGEVTAVVVEDDEVQLLPSGGNVGIGTTTPSHELNVVGDVNVTGVYYGNGSQLDVNSSTWWASVSGWVSGWFYKSGGDLAFNETKLNETIELLDTDTQKNASGYLYNDSTTIYLNDTILNATIEDLILLNSTNGVYIYDSGEKIYLNETKLNETILDISSQFNSTDSIDSVNSSLQEEITNRINNDSFLQSEIDTKLNITDQRYNDTDLINSVNTTSNIKSLGFNTTSELDTKYINQSEEANLNVNSSTWWASVSGWVSGWFIKTGDDLDFNETKLNNTIATEGVRIGFNSTYNATYAAKADYQFGDNNFNGSGDFNTTGNIYGNNGFFSGDVDISGDTTIDGNLNVTGISYLGNVTIDTDNITVNNIISRDGGLVFYNSSGSEIARMTESKNVGINTASPEEKLDVIGNIRLYNDTTKAELIFDSDAVSNAQVGGIEFQTSGVAIADIESHISDHVNDYGELRFSTTGVGGLTEWTYLLDDGTLEHSGTADFYDTVDISDNLTVDTDTFFVDASTDRVGIGTTTPSQKLEVGGNANFTGITYLNTFNRGTTDYYLKEEISGSFGAGTVDIIIPGVLVLDRDASGGGIYNIVSENAFGDSPSPEDTLWNSQFVGGTSGFNNLSDVQSRNYTYFKPALDDAIGDNIIGEELIMKVNSTNQYYMVNFSAWQSEGGGTWTYTRQEISFENPALVITNGTDDQIYIDNIGAYFNDNVHIFGLLGAEDTHIDGDVLITKNHSLLIGTGEGVSLGGDNNKLQVHGLDNESSSMTLGRWADDGYGPKIKMVKGSSDTIGVAGGTLNDNDEMASIDIHSGNNLPQPPVARYIAEIDDPTPVSDDVGMAWVWEQKPGSGGSLRETMRIAADGNVGIGTDNPSSKLEVNGNANISGNITFGEKLITGDVELDSVKYDMGTGVLYGGTISINAANSSLLDILEGKWRYVNYSDINNPVVKELTWENQTFYPGVNGFRNKKIFLSINASGDTEVGAQTEITQDEIREKAIIGRCISTDGLDTCNVPLKLTTPAFGLQKTTEDVMWALGSINVNNEIVPSANGSNLLLDVSAGYSFRAYANFAGNPVSPNVYYNNASYGITSYAYHLQNSTQTISESTIDPDYYDLNSVKTSVPVQKWTLQEIWRFPVSRTNHIIYGQAYYDSKGNCLSAIALETKERNLDILDGAMKIGYLCVREGASSLSDSDDAVIIQAGLDGGGFLSHWEREENGVGLLKPAEANDRMELANNFSVNSTFHVDVDSGRVGIGTYTPTHELNVVGSANITGNLTVGGSTLFADSTNDRVGIGTSSPDYTLDVAGDTFGVIGAGTGALFNLDDIGHGMAAGTEAELGVSGFDGNALVLRAGTAGSIGFVKESGSTSVPLNSPTTLFSVQADDGEAYFLGNVGIGTTEPTQELNVVGASNITQYSVSDFMYDRHIYRETFPNGDDGATSSGDKITGDIGNWTVGGTNVNIQTTNGPYGTSDAVRMTTDTYITSPPLDLSDYYQYEEGDHTDNEAYSQTRVFMKALARYWSLDSSAETILVEINDSDGNWHIVYESTSDDQSSDPRGYHKITADLTPYISETSTDNYLRFTIDGSGSLDYFDIDRVIIYESDVPTQLGYIHFGRDDITIKSDLNVTNNFTGNQIYGEAWGHEIGDVTISSSGVYYNITNLTSGELNGFTHSSGVLTPQVSGLYHIVSNFAFSGATTNEYHLGLIVNGVQQDKCHTQRKLGTGGDVGSAGFTCFYRLSSGDIVTLGIENAGAANDATIHDVDLNLVRVGD